MIKSILCAVDISQPTVETAVLEVAAQFAELNGAQLDVITVVPDFGMSVVGSYFNDDHTAKANAEAKTVLNKLVEGILGEAVNDKVRHIVATGSAYDEILKTAEAANSDLIVIGAHKPDFKDYLLGPNAARVVRHSDCSVYVVR